MKLLHRQPTVRWFTMPWLTTIQTQILFQFLLLGTSGIWNHTHAQDPIQQSQLNEYRPGNGIQMQSAAGHSMRFSGFIQPSLTTTIQKGDTLSLTSHRFRMRRIRLRLEGQAADPRFGYRFQTDLSGTGEELDGNNTYLLDAVVYWEPTKNLKFHFGQRAPYTDNRELWMNSYSLQLVERSRLTSAFASIREFGLFTEATVRLPGGLYLKPYLTLTNGDGPNVAGRDRGGYKWGGRIDVLPFGLFNSMGQFNQMDLVRERTPKLVIGAVYCYNTGISDRRGRESGSILYLDAMGRELLPDYARIGVDFLFKYRGFSILGEWMKSGAKVPANITQRVRTDGSVSQEFLVNGVNDVDAYVRGRMMLGSALNLQAGYVFKKHISLDARYNRMNSDQFSFLNNGTFYNRPEYYTVGISRLSGRHYGAKRQADFTRIKNNGGINDNSGLPIEAQEWMIRTMVTYTF